MQDTLEILQDIQARLFLIMKHFKIKRVTISELDLYLQEDSIEEAKEVLEKGTQDNHNS